MLFWEESFNREGLFSMDLGSRSIDIESEDNEYKVIRIHSGFYKLWVTLCPICERRIFDICSTCVLAAIRLKCPHCRKIVRISVISS